MKGVRVTTAARLHLGFLDFNGDLGRRFGSIGLAIDAFETCVQLHEALRFEVAGAERERGARLALRAAERLGLDPAKSLNIASAIPAHAGLGSGTQLAIAIASAFRRLAGLPLDPLGDARLLDRGARSGVGAALFERGGLVVDAGRGPNSEMPPVVARVALPVGLACPSDVGPADARRAWRSGKAGVRPSADLSFVVSPARSVVGR